ncbi:MAG: diacylglycerol kinase family lipid kinase [Parasphingorhabdus sp.]
MKVQLIYNPASGTHSDLNLENLRLAFQACSAEVAVTETSIEGDVAFEPGCDLVCVSGGDGALRLVVRAAVRAKLSAPICVYPAGTVNLIAKEIGYSSDPGKFASSAMAGLIKGDTARLSAPVIVYDDQAFVACLSAGPDGLAVAGHSPALKKRLGGMAYAIAAIKLLYSWPLCRFELEVKQEDLSIRALSCEAFYIAKGRHYAGNWSLAEEARLQSDQFYLLALRVARRRHFLRFILQIAMGRDPAALKFVEKMATRSLVLKSHAPEEASRAFQIDGDVLPHPVEKVEMLDESITYCIPVDD